MYICEDLKILAINLGDEYQREEWVGKLSDRNLFDALSACNRAVGPVIDSTRSLYRQMLIKLLKNGSTFDIVNSIDCYLGVHTDALDHWEKSGMRSDGYGSLNGDRGELDGFETKADSSGSSGSSTPAQTSPGVSYASVTSRGLSLDREPSPTPPTHPSPGMSGADRTSPVFTVVNDDQHQLNLSSDESFGRELYSIRKREMGKVGNRYLRDASPKLVDAVKQGTTELGGGRGRGVSDLKMRAYVYSIGLAFLIGLLYYLLNPSHETAPAEVEMEVNDELDLLIKQLENNDGAEA